LVKITREARLGISRPAALVLTSSATGAEAKAAEAKAAEEKAAAETKAAEEAKAAEKAKDDEKAKLIFQYSKNASQVTYPVHSH
jgi:septal ring factor EnvC (AmiA/AmiB activator)